MELLDEPFHGWERMAQTSRSDRLKFRVIEFEGKPTLFLHVHAIAFADHLTPTMRGVAVPPDQLDELAEAIERTRAVLRRGSDHDGTCDG